MCIEFTKFESSQCQPADPVSRHFNYCGECKDRILRKCTYDSPSSHNYNRVDFLPCVDDACTHCGLQYASSTGLGMAEMLSNMEKAPRDIDYGEEDDGASGEQGSSDSGSGDSSVGYPHPPAGYPPVINLTIGQCNSGYALNRVFQCQTMPHAWYSGQQCQVFQGGDRIVVDKCNNGWLFTCHN